MSSLGNSTKCRGWILLAVAISVASSAWQAGAAPPPLSGWDVAWYDEFAGNRLDLSKWEPVFSTNPTNNSLHAYLPSQVSVAGGNLELTSEDRSYQNLPYRSGQVVSRTAQRLGRWEVRAQLPTSRGMWPAIWLLPDVNAHPWPSGGEIDIMENRGDQPNLTSSAFHYGTNPPYHHSFVYQEQQSYEAGALSNYHDSFHTYAVEWDTDQLRFLVDDVHYYTVFDSDVGGFLSSSTAAMQTVINTAIGGDFLNNPDGSTDWPQQLLVDYVHVYSKSAQPEVLSFENGGFEQNGGSLGKWSTFGNRFPNVRSEVEAVQSGDGSLKVFGQFTGGTNYSGVQQGISVSSGEELRAVASAFIRSNDSIVGTQNAVDLKIEYYSKTHGRYGTGDYIGSDMVRLADGGSNQDDWLQNEIRSTAPSGAVEARVTIVFTQMNNQGGAVHVDDVSFGREGETTVDWYGGDNEWAAGDWLGGPYPQPTDFDEAVIGSGRVTLEGSGEAYRTLVSGGELQLAGDLASEVEIAAGGALAGVGLIDGSLLMEGTLLISSETQVVAAGDVNLAESATLALEDGYVQARGTLTEDLIVLAGNSLSGVFDIPAASGAESHLGDGYFLSDAVYSLEDVQVSIYSALLGDANGDGVVDTSDFNVWNSYKFQSGTDWTTGDFNHDGITDASDFNIWNANKFTEVAALVPEPTFGLMYLLPLALLVAATNKRRR